MESLPTLQLQLFHKSSSLIGTDLPMGIVEVSLDGIDADGGALEEWFSVQRVGKMKEVAGDVSAAPYFK